MVPAVYQLAVPNPFFEGRNRIYVIAADPVTMIDTGVATQQAYEVLLAGLRQHRLSIQDIRRVVLTHKHIDHLGNAWRIQQASGAEIWIHASECDAVVHVDPAGDDLVRLLDQRLVEWQTPARIRTDTFAQVMPHWEIEPAEVQPLIDGQNLGFEGGQLQVIHTPGHTIGSVCLRLGSHMFTGDHVLPSISPNVGGGDLHHRGLLAMFMASLQRIQRDGAGMLALPGHGQPFTTLVARCNELLEHHRQRLDQIRAVLDEGPLTIFQLADRLFGEMDDFNVVLGCAKAQSHLEWLTDHGLVESCDGGLRYRLV